MSKITARKAKAERVVPLRFRFTPEAIRFGQSLNFYDGDDIALHVIVRADDSALILNRRTAGAWGAKIAIDLNATQLQAGFDLGLELRARSTEALVDGQTRAATSEMVVPSTHRLEVAPGIEPIDPAAQGGEPSQRAGEAASSDPATHAPMSASSHANDEPEPKVLPSNFRGGAAVMAGAVDYVGADLGLCGWVIDNRANPTPDISVELRCLGEVLGVAPADKPRADLAPTSIVAPTCGFAFAWSGIDLEALQRVVRHDKTAILTVLVAPNGPEVPMVAHPVTAALALRFAQTTLRASAGATSDEASRSDIGPGAAGFHPSFYAAQLEALGLALPPEDFAAHYAKDGWRFGLDPHPLFRTTYYIRAQPGWASEAADPLTHYLTIGHKSGTAPHPLLVKHRLIANTQIDALSAYAELPAAERSKLFPAFSGVFYKAMYPDVDWDVEDPLLHYLGVGWRKGALPNPAFDPDYYRETTSYGAVAEDISPLEHFTSLPAPRPKTIPLFDGDFYLAKYPDLAGWCTCLVSHFLEYGVFENRQFSPFLVNDYLYEIFNTKAFADRPPISEYVASQRRRLSRFVFIGHEGTRTGAPGIILKLTQHLADYSGVECISILDQPGALVSDHARCSLTLIPKHNRHLVYGSKSTKEQMFAELDAAFSAFADNPPLGVFCNSAESRLYAEYFRARGVPVIMLMHEIAGFYPYEALERIVEDSDRVVFPAQFVADRMIEAIPSNDQYAVIPQGLLRDGFGDIVLGDRQELFGDYGVKLDSDDIVVLACGTIDGRKGFDLFVQTAKQVRGQLGDKVKFVWVGGKPNWRMGEGAVWDTTGYWASWDMRQLELESTVIAINEVANPEPFFVHADMFVMSSRADPFPCVVHEAMAARLPILSFENAGGSPEAFLPDAGLTVPYLDHAALADAIIGLAQDGPRRQEMGRLGRERILTDFRFETYGHRLLALMSEISPEVATASLGDRRAEVEPRPRIFFPIAAWTDTEANRLIATLVTAMNDAGYDAEILLTTGRFGALSDAGAPNARYRYLQPAYNTPANISEALQGFLTAHAPAVVVIGLDPVATGLIGRFVPGIRPISMARMGGKDEYEAIYRIGRDLDAIIASSEEVKKGLLENNPGFASVTEVVKEAAALPTKENIGRIDAKSEDTGQLRVSQLPDGGSLTVARSVSARVTSLLRERGVDVRITPLSRSLIEGGNFAEAATSAHAVLAPNSADGSRGLIIEALQHGCIPIVIGAETSDLIEHGVNGFLVDRPEPAEIAAVLQTLASDPDLRRRMMYAATTTSERRGLTAKAMAEGYGRVVRRLIRPVELAGV